MRGSRRSASVTAAPAEREMRPTRWRERRRVVSSSGAGQAAGAPPQLRHLEFDPSWQLLYGKNHVTIRTVCGEGEGGEVRESQ